MDLPGWQALREELHPAGLEVVTVCLEVTGPDVGREFVDAAAPTHPSLLDVGHEMAAKFGVVNIPNAVWIDEEGVIVRPAEPAWPPTAEPTPEQREQMRRMREEFARRAASEAATSGAATGDAPAQERPRANFTEGGQDRAAYPDAIRDWVARGAASPFALSPDEVVARSQPRPVEVSEAAAEFELGHHLWRAGRRDAAIAHFDRANQLQPENWAYKRQSWSVVSRERVDGPMGLFAQGPTGTEGEEPWPFSSDFRRDVAALGPGEYYPNTM